MEKRKERNGFQFDLRKRPIGRRTSSPRFLLGLATLLAIYGCLWNGLSLSGGTILSPYWGSWARCSAWRAAACPRNGSWRSMRRWSFWRSMRVVSRWSLTAGTHAQSDIRRPGSPSRPDFSAVHRGRRPQHAPGLRDAVSGDARRDARLCGRWSAKGKLPVLCSGRTCAAASLLGLYYPNAWTVLLAW